jgi:hypothetical protein
MRANARLVILSGHGQLAPTIAIRPGETQFWRIGNIDADLFTTSTSIRPRARLTGCPSQDPIQRSRGIRANNGLGVDVLAGCKECRYESTRSPHARQVVAGYLEDFRTRN